MYEVLSFIYRESKKMKFNLILMKTNLIVSASLEDDEIFLKRKGIEGVNPLTPKSDSHLIM